MTDWGILLYAPTMTQKEGFKYKDDTGRRIDQNIQ